MVSVFLFMVRQQYASSCENFHLVFCGVCKAKVHILTLPKNSPQDCFLYGRLRVPVVAFGCKINIGSTCVGTPYVYGAPTGTRTRLIIMIDNILLKIQ